MKKLLFLFVLMLTALSMSAQTNSTHTVKRGETIKSVAKKYGVSVSDLKNANPATKRAFHAGMKLVIPKKSAPARKKQPQSKTNPVKRNAITTSKTKTKPKNRPINTSKHNTHKPVIHNDIDRSDFTSAGVFFGHDFSDFIGMTYGVQGQYFLNNGFGATLAVGANYGLEDDPDLVFRIGPSYVYPISKTFYVMGTACYTLNLESYEGESGTISGVSIIPTIGASFDCLKIGINGDIHWRNGGNIGAGAYISVAYSF